jgi:hypothetical protein
LFGTLKLHCTCPSVNPSPEKQLVDKIRTTGGENKAHGTSNFASTSPKGRRNVEQIVGERGHDREHMWCDNDDWMASWASYGRTMLVVIRRESDMTFDR